MQHIKLLLFLLVSLVMFSAQAPQQTLTEDWVRMARVVRVIDGDTLELDVDLGYKVHLTDKFRLGGVDTPEVYGVKKTSEAYKKGKAASAFTAKWVEDNDDAKGNVIVVSEKDEGKYGRWIVTLYPASGQGKSLNQALLDSGHAKPYK
jgi:micrococcal nuclease